MMIITAPRSASTEATRGRRPVEGEVMADIIAAGGLNQPQVSRKKS